ncbi:Rad2 family DNA repair protein [Chryseobacterium oryctis]|uniref:Uncharacterized protein n=1 Tax=Chryseobacterium oryctis TaxID=2952618 RepID=A0ABT3HM39_9FLAO|nr:hypothetical protein [Chryseobacterium oryctis]MCW3160693.1 hypothetical protein [Chryseobacterium oryctis]
MQNIQDLKEKIFFESKNIIDILDKINNVDELLSKQDLVDELGNRISFLRLLEKNIEYFIPENNSQSSESKQNISLTNSTEPENHESANEVTEEEAIFNNELNEIDENEENTLDDFTHKKAENETFNSQLNEIEESELSEYHESTLSFVDEERILANSEPENEDDINEEMFNQETTEEEAIFNNQLNEIDEFENEISENQGNSINDFDEEEKIQFSFEPEKIKNEASEIVETIPSIFDSEIIDEEEILVEENEDQFVASNISIEQGEMVTETSNVENVLSEIKNEAQIEEKNEEILVSESIDRRKIVDIDKPVSEAKENQPSDESFENTDTYHQDKKIKLANIKGLKAVQTLFDDDPLERENPVEPSVKDDVGSILKTNIPTDFMEAEKAKPEFKLDLNDRIAFSKMLFGGSQSELNEVVSELNRFKTLDDAKEYLSDLYYAKKWHKVDEYAQRLWILVENKFL